MPPVIGDFQESQQLPDDPTSTDVGVERFGKDAAALYALGGDIGNFGARLIQARKEAEETDAVANASAAYREWHTIKSNELMTKNPSGFADELREEVNARMASDLEAMPTGDAQRKYRERMDSFNASSFNQSYAMQAMNKIQEIRAGFDARIGNSANQQALNPSLNGLQRDLDQHLLDIQAGEGTIYSKEEADKMRQGAKRTLVRGLMVGYTQNQETSQEGLAVLNSMSEGDLLSEALAPEEVYTWRERLEQSARDNRAKQKHDFNTAFRGAVDSISSQYPEQRKTVTADQIEALKERSTALSQGKDAEITEQDNVRNHLILDSAREIGQIFGAMEQQSLEEIDASLANAQQKYTDAVAKSGYPHIADDVHNAFQERANAAKNAILAERARDMNSYIERVFQGQLPGGFDEGGVPDATRLGARMEASLRLGQRSPTLLSNGELAAQRMQLEKLGEADPDKAVARIHQISQHPMGAELIRELSKDSGMPYYLTASSFMEDPAAMRSVIVNGHPRRAAELRSFEASEGFKLNADKFEKAFEAKVTPFTRNVLTAGAANGEATYALKKAVRDEAVANMMSGSDHASAIDAAYKKIIGKNFTTAGTVIFRNEINGYRINPDLVEARMQSIYNQKNWEKWDIQLPQVPHDKDGKLATHRMKEIMRHGKWVAVTPQPRSDGRGWESKADFGAATFMLFRDPTDPKSGYPMTDRHGKPITMDHLAATLRPVEEEVSRHSWTKSWLPKGLTEAFLDSLDNPTMENQSELQDMKGGYWSKPWGKKDDKGRSPQSIGNAIPAEELQFDPEEDVKAIYRKTYGLPTPTTEGEPAEVVKRYDEDEGLPLYKQKRYLDLPTKVDPKPRQDIEIGSASASWLQKSYEHAPLIQQEELRNSMPPGLLYWQLFRESSFNSKATSKVKAQGVGQFMWNAAWEMGLVKTSDKTAPATYNSKGQEVRKTSNRITLDNRNNPKLAIPAAAKYMSKLASQFGGDWTKALAAYNMGAGALKKQLHRHNGDFKKAIAGYPETKAYVEAVLSMGEHPVEKKRYENKFVKKKTVASE